MINEIDSRLIDAKTISEEIDLRIRWVEKYATCNRTTCGEFDNELEVISEMINLYSDNKKLQLASFLKAIVDCLKNLSLTPKYQPIFQHYLKQLSNNEKEYAKKLQEIESHKNTLRGN